MRQVDSGSSSTHTRRSKKLTVAWLFAKTGLKEDFKYNCTFCKEAEYYKSRNCSKFFPNQPRNKDYRWEPEFYTPKGMSFGVTETGCTECPVSYITPASRHLIQIECQNQIMKESGASMYGPDLSKWPSRIADAFCRIAVVRNEHNNEQHRAHMEEL